MCDQPSTSETRHKVLKDPLSISEIIHRSKDLKLTLSAYKTSNAAVGYIARFANVRFSYVSPKFLSKGFEQTTPRRPRNTESWWARPPTLVLSKELSGDCVWLQNLNDVFRAALAPQLADCIEAYLVGHKTGLHQSVTQRLTDILKAQRHGVNTGSDTNPTTTTLPPPFAAGRQSLFIEALTQAPVFSQYPDNTSTSIDDLMATNQLPGYGEYYIALQIRGFFISTIPQDMSTNVLLCAEQILFNSLEENDCIPHHPRSLDLDAHSFLCSSPPGGTAPREWCIHATHTDGPLAPKRTKWSVHQQDPLPRGD